MSRYNILHQGNGVSKCKSQSSHKWRRSGQQSGLNHEIAMHYLVLSRISWVNAIFWPFLHGAVLTRTKNRFTLQNMHHLIVYSHLYFVIPILNMELIHHIVLYRDYLMCLFSEQHFFLVSRTKIHSYVHMWCNILCLILDMQYVFNTLWSYFMNKIITCFTS